MLFCAIIFCIFLCECSGVRLAGYRIALLQQPRARARYQGRGHCEPLRHRPRCRWSRGQGLTQGEAGGWQEWAGYPWGGSPPNMVNVTNFWAYAGPKTCQGWAVEKKRPKNRPNERNFGHILAIFGPKKKHVKNVKCQKKLKKPYKPREIELFGEAPQYPEVGGETSPDLPGHGGGTPT